MNKHTDLLTGFLADTWWFGMSNRLSESAFLELATLRANQGFSAIQLIVGIPPEVGPDNPQGHSDAGPAWTLDGKINKAFLQLAQTRIAQLNNMGLRVIIYGAWGHQIDWTGAAFMQQWWQQLVETLDDLDVIYCLCGEVGLWLGQADQLLPDRSTDDIIQAATARKKPQQRFSLRRKIRDNYHWRIQIPRLHKQRIQAWSQVLDHLSSLTSRPILLHVNSGQQARELLPNASLLSANTTQTGHTESSRNHLWSLPLTYLEKHPDDCFINLEPWYEGIRDSFYEEDQLFAYWTSMLAGCCSYCYGAHGVWNVGDGNFMSHWGSQTFRTASHLRGAALVGQSHRFFINRWEPGKGRPAIHEQDGKLLSIYRHHNDEQITYIPAAEHMADLPEGEIWLPLQGRTESVKPNTGAVVIISRLHP